MSIFFQRYCCVPRKFAPEMLSVVRDAATYRLYLFLCSEMERLQKPILRLKNEDIATKTALASGSIIRGRNTLKLRGFIDFNRGTGGVYTYLILDEGELAQQRSKPYRRFADPRDKMRTRKPKAGDTTEFPFGWNLDTSALEMRPRDSDGESRSADRMLKDIGESFEP